MHYPFLLNCSAATDIISRIRNRLLKQFGIPSLDEKLRQVCATTAFINSYFLHFAGSMYDMRLVDQHVESWSDISHPAGSRSVN